MSINKYGGIYYYIFWQAPDWSSSLCFQNFVCLLTLFAAFVCPHLMDEFNIEEGIDFPLTFVEIKVGNEEVISDDIVTSVGIDVDPNDAVNLTNFPFHSILMDMNFDLVGAERVTITWDMRFDRDYVFEVHNFVYLSG